MPLKPSTNPSLDCSGDRTKRTFLRIPDRRDMVRALRGRVDRS